MIQHTGMFQPGRSGNPLGRPKADQTIRDLARVHTSEAIETLVAIAKNPKASDSARVQACNTILDRGWGKAAQLNQNVNVGMTYMDFLDNLDKKEKEIIEIEDLKS